MVILLQTSMNIPIALPNASTCKSSVTTQFTARFASIYAHKSRMVCINVLDDGGCMHCNMYAHQKLGSKLFIYVLDIHGKRYTTLHAPINKGSEMWKGWMYYDENL